MSNQQQAIIAQAEENADATIIEISKELQTLVHSPTERLRVLAMMHHYAERVAAAALEVGQTNVV